MNSEFEGKLLESPDDLSYIGLFSEWMTEWMKDVISNKKKLSNLIKNRTQGKGASRYSCIV